MTEGTYSRSFWWSLAGHVALLTVLATATLWRSCRRPPKPREVVTYVDLQSVPDVPFRAVEQLPTPPAPPEPTPPPPAPRDIPEPTPKPKPKPKLKRPEDIVRSTHRVRRPDAAPRRAPPRPLTPEQVRRMLASGAPAASPGGTVLDTFPSWYFSLVRQKMYEAWDQPGELSASAGLVCEVRIRVAKDGRIVDRELVGRSGNRLMDDSVMAAVRSVSQLKPLPEPYDKPSRDITIAFELTRGER